MKKSDFLAMVQHELDTIKTNATAEEIDKLDFNEFDHCSSRRCIYGQMTGKCDSKRAEELYPKSFSNIGVGGSWDYKPFKTQNLEHGISFTPLEKYLYMLKAPQHKKIIQYLKGEIFTIKL
jgi:hypothetical protein